jgi:hypothetical protein
MAAHTCKWKNVHARVGALERLKHIAKFGYVSLNKCKRAMVHPEASRIGFPSIGLYGSMPNVQKLTQQPSENTTIYIGVENLESTRSHQSTELEIRCVPTSNGFLQDRGDADRPLINWRT